VATEEKIPSVDATTIRMTGDLLQIVQVGQHNTSSITLPAIMIEHFVMLINRVHAEYLKAQEGL
jgi:hypothetical protein